MRLSAVVRLTHFLIVFCLLAGSAAAVNAQGLKAIIVTDKDTEHDQKARQTRHCSKSHSGILNCMVTGA